ncbi:isochorismatase family protein [Pedobacter sp. HMF7647]|uniref:Isochorismatase family protein n=1 Tax=Hufsiella arboris TaxID=2695275 RepID=A0A7K1YA11_9SPHI|nr:isochorismatase family cysteine hydrolase [Hufsiella arboris]MXV51412.1 isochorismatase family protein [Hufsiella arboris]
MQALIIIDAQNEFSGNGKRPVPDIERALKQIRRRLEQSRRNGSPIAWVRHFNKPDESPAFVPDTWGSEFLPGLGPLPGSANETEFHKDVYGAFTGSEIGKWLKDVKADEILLTGFYTHGCVSTTAREGIMAGLTVFIDPEATATCDINDDVLGWQSADEVKRSALLQLINMGVSLSKF